VEAVDELTAKQYVRSNHYSGSYPAAQYRYGLYEAGEMVGVAVLGVPMTNRVLTNTFPDLEPCVESVELSRLVLADRVPSNGESWFLARCFTEAAAAGVRGVVTFADPVPRSLGDRLLFPGHIGLIYQASNARYCGRATPRTLTLLPDGRVFSDRSAQKVRRNERGHEHVERSLVALGARPRRSSDDGAQWLRDALDDVKATRLRHAGNHRYAFAIGSRAQRRRLVVAGAQDIYPKKACA
jgi:hypothetical protein